MRGTVTRIKESYGFIKGVDGVTRFFIPSSITAPHHTFDDFREGMEVVFDHEDHAKGDRATNIRPFEAEEE